MIAFLDANALIYRIEGQEPQASAVQSELSRLSRAHPGLRVALSRLSWLECRIGPMRRNDSATLARFDAFFALPDLIWLEMDCKAVELAAAIRARHGTRTPDALQAACCLQLGNAHVMLTGDTAFMRISGLNVSLLQ